ncbi:MAG: hypothetical protein KGS72_17190 [Cyanobacteria bacterium REEB67]|nr:hypothetical protein [Cyanobacteria bacterium REEB67]
MNKLKVIAPVMTVALTLAACSNAPVLSSADKSAASEVAKQPATKTSVESGESIKEFWTWFNLHQQDLSAMNGPDAPIFPEIGQHIKAIDDSLVFEIGPAPEGEKEFAVSANGNEALFPLVKNIVAAAPQIKGWKIVAFRQKTPPAILKQLAISAQPTKNGQVIAGAEPMGVAVKDMRFTIKKDGDMAKVTIFIKNFKDDGPQSHMAEMMLHQAVGEYDLVKKIKEIDCKPDNAPEAKNAKPFEELGDALDKLLPDAK